MMDWLATGLDAGKAFFVVMFGMNVAVLLTWADRRQGAVIQDRVGPNRALFLLPKRLVQALAVLPAFGVAGAIIAFYVFVPLEGGYRTGRAMLFSQLAIFMLWLTGLVIAGRVRNRGVRNSFDRWIQSLGDPRTIFWAGLGAHAFTLVVGALFRGTVQGRDIRDFAYGASPAVLALVIVGGGVYTLWTLEKGDDKVGFRLYGLLHPAADGLKTIWKEDFIPPNSDKFLHSIAPIISFFPALVVLGVVPFGDTLCFGTKEGKLDLTQLMRVVPADGVCTDGAVRLQALDLNVGILYFFALAGTGIVGAALAGWASDNKFSLLGGLRAASQMVSYEVTLGLTIVGALMVYGTIRLDEMVRWQAANSWGIFVQPVGFVLFFAASIAESKRIPFDLPEGESELVAGYFTEYSGMKFAMFFFSEYVAVVSSSALIATLFLGGWHLPFIDRSGIHLAFGDTVILTQTLSHPVVILLGFLAFVLKTVALCWLQLMIRWTLPRFRYDQLMRLGWRKLLPASLVNILVTGLVILAIQSFGPSAVSGLAAVATLTQALVAVAGIAAAVWFVLFLTSPAKHRRVLASSAAQIAASIGGTRTAKMGA
jgi:NADH-quinone oxidoreductase subunit H